MKKLFLFCLIFLGAISISAETWTPVGQVKWSEGILSYNYSKLSGREWYVNIERSNERSNVFRMQPYSNHPATYKTDNTYIYVHVDGVNKIYIESFTCFTGYSDYSTVKQRCPENGFDSMYYGTLYNDIIEFPIGSFEVNWKTNSIFYSRDVHKIVFPKGILDSQPETFVNIGKGEWQDAFWFYSVDGLPLTKTVEFERSVQNSGVYRVKLFDDSDYIKINAENTSKVYVTPYSHTNAAGNVMVVTQRCAENGVNESYYGTMNNGIITIPGNYFRYNQDGSTSYTNCDADRMCIITLPEGYNTPIEDDNGIFMGVISFNDKIDNLPITVLNQLTEPMFMNFVDNMEMENATLLYYAVDQAITSLAKPEYPDNLSNAMIITFTDGLDQGSLAMAPEHLTSRNYAQYLSERISSTQIQGLPLQAYTIGLKSDDVADDDMFEQNLKSLSSDSTKYHSVSDIDGVQEELTKIYDELNRQTSQRVVSITVPMMSHGDTYRFTLDGTVDPSKVADSELWIEGVFSITDVSLDDLTYHGFTSTSGSKVTAERNGVYITFTFNDCRDEDGEILEIGKNDIDQWTYIPSSNTWQHNVENDKDGKINIEDIRTSAAIMFVLDCSRSLGDLFPTLKQTANSFIDRLAGGDGNITGVENVTISNEDIDEDAPVEYYNLQGVRIMKPEKGLYIQRQGNSVKKIMIK